MHDDHHVLSEPERPRWNKAHMARVRSFDSNFLILAAVGLAACAPSHPTVSAAPSSPGCVVEQASMVRDALFFGQSIPGDGMIADSAWEAFLVDRVTPAFPTGFTIIEASGQWREATGHVAKEPTRILLVVHPPSAGIDSTLTAIKAEYLKRFAQEAVMWERTGACISF